MTVMGKAAVAKRTGFMKTDSVMWNQTPVVPSETGNEDHSDSGIDADDHCDRSSAVNEQNDPLSKKIYGC